MVLRRSPSAQKVLEEVKIENFLQASTERDNISETMRQALISMEEKPEEYRIHLEKVHYFLATLWTKYDCEDVVGILDALTLVEPPLLDLERGALQKYRDHYVHIFNVFVLGLRILSSLIEKLGDERASRFLKVRDESLSSKIPEFHDYHWKERLFYLWTLISNFHDISIPVTRLGGVNEALNAFVDKFNLEVSGPTLLPYYPSDFEDYIQLLGCIFDGKMQEVENGCYKRDHPNCYVQSVLRHEFARQNHGVLSGFLMYKKLHEIFLTGRNKRPLSLNSFNNYVECVLKQDVGRAALAISLHDLKPDTQTKYPSFFPLDFVEYPLICLLILVDSLQEYLRWEGTSIRGGTKLLSFPELQLETNDEEIYLRIVFFVAEEPDANKYLIDQAKHIALIKGETISKMKLGQAVNYLCESVANELASRLRQNDSFQISLVFCNTKRELLSRNIHI